jgi:hypothetical protein
MFKLFSFNEQGKPCLFKVDPDSTVHVWMAFGNLYSGANVLVNFIGTTKSFEIVLNDFLLPLIVDFFPPTGQPAKRILCQPNNLHIWREWASHYPVSLIVLPPDSSDLNPCNSIFAKILDSISHLKMSSAEQLWFEIADTFDRLTSCLYGLRNTSVASTVVSSMMPYRLEQV